ncbi:flavodoxin I [Thalassobacillus cyri]|uniref:Flavodoxin n=2 Tax=Thalassobacillus cyri TaxID=571932 RepID=A0A1H3W7A3_9BACI|nr:flavodoxin I [Thalassobacillus cyri]
MSGNTEEIADLIYSYLETDHNVEVKEIEDIDPASLLEYDCVLLGSYTWNDGDLPYEVEDFYEELEDIELSGIVAAVFGSGDSIYPQFCEAVHLLENQLKASGAYIIVEGLKVEMTPDTEEDLRNCKAFSEAVLGYLSEVKV